MEARMGIVDAFSDRAFGGNPAAICVLEQPADASWMQSVAQEMNLSETAFLTGAGSAWQLRWFTPRVEVELCGHATLAAAHWLWSEGHAPRGSALRFSTQSGTLQAVARNAGVELDFPSLPIEPADPPEELLSALGAQALRAGRSRHDWLIEVSDAEALRALRPDFDRLARVPARGVIVTAGADAEYDCWSRFFAPAAGVNEDPVTGSAHCVLGPYWAERLGRRELLAYQASARGGVLRVRVEGERTALWGQAVTVLRGELAIRAAPAQTSVE